MGGAAIEWQSGDLSAAFKLAAGNGRPLFLYWGAGWCPPCNRVKADIFSRSDFAQRMRNLLPFWLDGDAPGAQALAAQYRLRSYPTLVLFSPEGREITRLPCELDGEQFIAALDIALAAQHTAAASLQAALNGSRALDEAEWSLLSLYSWDTDEGNLSSAAEQPAVLARLAAACPPGDACAKAAARLHLHAQVAAAGRIATGGPAGNASASAAQAAAAIAAAADRLLAVFGDPHLARANMDILVNSGVNLIKWSGARQAELVSALGQAARGFAADPSLSAGDRLMAVRLQMRMVRIGAPADGMVDLVKQTVEQVLEAEADPYARHTLVNTAVSALNDAGLPQQAEALLQSELVSSHSPYYFMLSLASAARRRGDTAGTLRWYEQAWAAAEGSATRLQWGTTYLTSVLDLTPQDLPRIEAAAAELAQEIAGNPDAYQQRNRTQLQRLASKLALLTVPGPHASALQRTLTSNL
ncbi:thioredoxin family protein [Pseudoduganella ginsengisoli]|uniref:Thioredoxin fold domain-containing protein n=1 Tax=Pseudoduganella ginsengisoli TaxID=1462440 RepID=A0A6L6PZ04_9BURK|nr:thioredoxin family protein [Pseudoduganella ginsengisoli]MTW02665.1 thioredoxin fold domain-containing protein [Pseudoduganella ginsengisoli]